MFILLIFSSLVTLIMFEFSTTTTTPPVTGVCTGALNITMTVLITSTSMVTWRFSSSEWTVATTTDSDEHIEGCHWLCCYAISTVSSWDQSTEQDCLLSLRVMPWVLHRSAVLFESWALLQYSFVAVMILLSTVRFQYGPITPMRAQQAGFASLLSFRIYSWQIYLPPEVLDPC